MKSALQRQWEALDTTHPAQRASFLSLWHSREKNKNAWVNLYADDAIVEDPVGPSCFDPTGAGYRGKIAIAQFWDRFMGRPQRSEFEVIQSFPAGDECANHFIGSHYQPDGTVYVVPVISVYRTNSEGKLLSMRAYWNASTFDQSA